MKTLDYPITGRRKLLGEILVANQITSAEMVTRALARTEQTGELL